MLICATCWECWRKLQPHLRQQGICISSPLQEHISDMTPVHQDVSHRTAPSLSFLKALGHPFSMPRVALSSHPTDQYPATVQICLTAEQYSRFIWRNSSHTATDSKYFDATENFPPFICCIIQLKVTTFLWWSWALSSFYFCYKFIWKDFLDQLHLHQLTNYIIFLLSSLNFHSVRRQYV